MNISTRLTRAGLACLVFGICASLLPSNGIEIASADNCPNASPTNTKHRTNTAAIASGVAAGAVLLMFAEPTVFGISGGGLLGGGSVAGLAGFDPASQLSQFTYDSTGPAT